MSTGLIAYFSSKGTLTGFYYHEGNRLANTDFDLPIHEIIAKKYAPKKSFDFNKELDHVICPLNLLKWS